MKQRAGNNRTIYLLDGEMESLSGRFLSSTQNSYSEEEVLDRIIWGDLMSVIDRLPGEFADLIIIDPPYNISKNYNGLKFAACSDAEYFKYINSWFPAVCRCLKPTGSIYVCGDWRSTGILQTVIGRYLHIINRITWQREKGRGAKHNWKNAMEDIWFGVKNVDDYYFDVESVKQKRRVIAPYKEAGKPKDWFATDNGNYRLTYPSNFWDDISIPYWSMPENTDHPTQKPEKLMAKLILASCPESGVVFDPFLGSGTTAVTAKKLGRHYCGIEINKEYACLAEKRLLLADNDKNIQGYVDGVFWERNTLSDQKKTLKTARSSNKNTMPSL